MSLITWIKTNLLSKVETDYKAAYSKVEDLVGLYAGPIEVAMATTAKAEYAALTPALWATIQGFASTAAASVEKLAQSGDLKWSAAMAALEADLKTAGIATFSTTTKETLLQAATSIVKAGLFAGLTAAGIPTPASSAAPAPAQSSPAPSSPATAS